MNKKKKLQKKTSKNEIEKSENVPTIENKIVKLTDEEKKIFMNIYCNYKTIVNINENENIKNINVDKRRIKKKVTSYTLKDANKNITNNKQPLNEDNNILDKNDFENKILI